VTPAVVIPRLLRAPGDVAKACRDSTEIRALAATSLGCLVVGAGAFGAATGSLRGGVQIAISAAKMPIALLGALIVACPAFFALAAIFGRPMSARTMTALALSSGARGALVLLACAPPLWLAIDLGLPYEATKLVAVVSYGLAGMAALSLFVRGFGDGAGRAEAVLSCMVVLLLASAQTAWTLRPFIGDPADREVPRFVHDRVEGGLGGALVRAVQGLRAPWGRR
jgi:hypothetical protein